MQQPTNLSDDSSSSEDEIRLNKSDNDYFEDNYNYSNTHNYNASDTYNNDPSTYNANCYGSNSHYNHFSDDHTAQSSQSESDDGSPQHINKKMRYSESEDEDMKQRHKSKYDSLAVPVDEGFVRSDKAQAMMEKMGYKRGEGLGKKSQGRVNPIEMSTQRGRRGLGLKLPGLEPATLQWDSSLEVVKVEEDVSWLDSSKYPDDPIPIDVLESWVMRGEKNLEMESYTDFCDPELLQNVLKSKSVFDSLDGEELRRARTRSNPFETIGKGIFQNRAAMKMANMDKVFDFMFTDPQDQEGKPLVENDSLLYFADVCAGPGGFSEYVLWRKKWRAKGFGFTLRNENDFKLSDFFSGPVETFEPYYGESDDGNIFDPKNIISLEHFVKNQTENLGVHFMMADGGFSVDGQENIQELLSKQLYLCQCLVALTIVRPNGHFVCKLFDIFSPFSVGIVYLMYRSFVQISIHKPNTSRPANSERYIICKWKREECNSIRQYMFDINEELWKMGRNSKQDITHIVPLDEIMEDKEFYEYIIRSNNELGERQVVNLIKIQAFCRDTNLLESKQAEMRRKCLQYWELPDKARRADNRAPEEWANNILKNVDRNFLKSTGDVLTSGADLEHYFKSIYDWHCIPVGNKNECYFFIGLGRNKVYRLALGGKYWAKVENMKVELSPGTMVYAEMVNEIIGEFKSQRKSAGFHILDAITLGEEPVWHYHYTRRLELCNLYVKALQKYYSKEYCPVRVKTVHGLENLREIFEGRLTYKTMKNGTQEFIFNNDSCEYPIKGIIFFKATKDPFTRNLSRTHKVHYYASPNHKSKFEKEGRPQEACATAMESIEKRKLWWWEPGVGLLKEPPVEGILHKHDLAQFIKNKEVILKDHRPT